jgi:hypothetical protein
VTSKVQLTTIGDLHQRLTRNAREHWPVTGRGSPVDTRMPP